MSFATSKNAPAQERQPDAYNSYPNKLVRVIVTVPPGGPSDYNARLIAKKMSENLKQNFIVDNRAGAAGIIAMEMGAKAPPDGYTILFGTVGTVATNFAVYEKLPYHPIRDYAPISKAVEAYFILSVHPGVPANTVQEFVALAKAQPGKITYATFGVGSFSHLLTEWFSSIAGVKLNHVPYKGAAPAVADLIAGQVNCAIDSLSSALPYVRQKRLRALAIGSAKRYHAAPDIPTFVEAGYPQFKPLGWWGFLAPANTPQPIINKLNEEIRKALTAVDVREGLEATGAIPVGNSPDEFAKQIKTDVDLYTKVAREANIRAE
jgi:tripartite-type tricarboxylate transporter receptor subunit TctC